MAGSVNKLVLGLLLCLTASFAWDVPQAYGFNPAPAANYTSSAYCKLASSGGAAVNLNTTVFYQNGTMYATNTIASVARNEKIAGITDGFTSIENGSNIYTTCIFDGGNYNATSLLQTIHQHGFGTTSDDNLSLGTLLGLSFLVIIFAYLYTNSKSELWAELWLFVSVVLAIITMLSINGFAETDGANGISSVAIALFLAFSGLFFFTYAVFIGEFFIRLGKDAINRFGAM